jgi:hypothetical protein
MPPTPSTAPTTDWTSDPIYQLALGQNETAVKNAQAAALTSRIQALIAYGDPRLALAVTGDQNVADAAAANQGSTLAQLIAGNAKTVRDTNESENQANLWYSSDRGYQLGLAQQNYLNNASGALSNVQGQLGTIGANLLAQQQGAYANEAQAASAAYSRAIANPIGLPTSTPDIQSQVAASKAANPQAAGSNGSLFTYSGSTPMPDQYPGQSASAPKTNNIPPTGQSGYAQASKSNLH